MLAQAHTAVSAAGADGFTVKGLVVDSITGEGEPYATVRIENAAAPGKAVKMGVTQKDGRFTLSLAAKGKYRLTVSSMGRADVVKDFAVDPLLWLFELLYFFRIFDIFLPFSLDEVIV